MKKIISFVLAITMIFSISIMAFAKADGNYTEEQTCKDIKINCDCCADCTGLVGCACECAGCYAKATNGVLDNAAKLSGCSYNSYVFKVDSFDNISATLVPADGKTHSYFLPPCCDKCTGLVDCHCAENDNCDCIYCPRDTSHDVEDKIEEIKESGRQGFVKGVQTAIAAVRDVMYDLFNRLFEFLRLEDILGKRPQFPK